MESIQNLCPKTIVLENGKIVGVGETGQMILQYTTDTFNLLQSDPKLFFKNLTRRGEGDVLFEDIQIINNLGEINTFQVEESTKLVFKIKIKYNILIEKSKCVVAFKSAKYNEIITSSGSYYLDHSKINETTKTLDFKITFESLNLLPGRYYLYFWLGTGKTKGKLDILDNDIPPLIVLPNSKEDELKQRPVGFYRLDNNIKYGD
jgi:hypothetical protein